MRRWRTALAVGVLSLSLVAASPGVAAAADTDVSTWTNAGGGISGPRTLLLPPVGSFSHPSLNDWVGAVCRTAVINVGSGSLLVKDSTTFGVRCHGRPTLSATLTTASISYTNSGYGTTGLAAASLDCVPAGGHAPMLGRISMTCMYVGTNGAAWDPRVFEGSRYEISPSFLFGSGPTLSQRRGIGPPSAANRASVGWDLTQAHDWVMGYPSSVVMPSWPSWWPSTAEVLEPLQFGRAPYTSCSATTTLDANGDVRAQFSVTTSRGDADMWNWEANEIDWVYEWERDPELPGGEPSSPSFWTDRPVHEGRVQRWVKVPKEGTDALPPNGGKWTATVRVRFLYDDSTGYGYMSTTHLESLGWERSEDGVWFNPTPTPSSPGGTVREVFEWLDGLGGESWHGALVLMDDQYGHQEQVDEPGEVYSTAWSYCTVVVQPSKAHTSDGGSTTVVDPEGTGPPVGTPGPDDDEGGGGGCEKPEGLNKLNPIAWASYGACSVDIFGSLLDAISALLSAIGGLVDELLAGLVGLLVPEQSWSDRQLSMSSSLDGSGAGDLFGSIGTIFEGWQSAAEAASGGTCAGPELPYYVPDLEGGYVEHTTQPLDSCTGTMATFRVAIRTITSGAIAFVAVAFCYNSVAKRMGWDTVQGGDDES